jgi:hypothetical protein
MDLYVYSPLRLRGLVLNMLSSGTTFPLLRSNLRIRIVLLHCNKNGIVSNKMRKTSQCKIPRTPVQPFKHRDVATLICALLQLCIEVGNINVKDGNNCGHANWPKERRRVKNIGTKI